MALQRQGGRLMNISLKVTSTASNESTQAK